MNNMETKDIRRLLLYGDKETREMFPETAACIVSILTECERNKYRNCSCSEKIDKLIESERFKKNFNGLLSG